MDTTALETIKYAAVNADEVTMVLKKIDAKELNEKQQKALEGKTIADLFRANILCGDKIISNFNATLQIPFTRETGYEEAEYKVFCVADDGAVTESVTKCESNQLSVSLSCFSDLAIVNTAFETTEPTEPTPTEPTEPEPSAPSEPTAPSESTEPANPTAPSEPDASDELTEPDAPTLPTETTDPESGNVQVDSSVPLTIAGIILGICVLTVGTMLILKKSGIVKKK